MAITMNFLSWQRSAIVADADEDGGRLKRSLVLTLDDTGDAAAPIDFPLSIAFPAASDVATVKQSAIRHLAPKSATADAETTKFVHIDFFEPDVPWRYTPKRPMANGALKPWLALLVGTADEMQVAAGLVTVRDSVLLQHDLASSELWAHVQQDETGRAFSRLLSPRKLVPQQCHVAALVPAFTSTGESMWAAAMRNFTELPAFFSWEFQAAEEGDFETLARALRLRPSGNLGVATLYYDRPVTNVKASLSLGGAITSLAAHPSLPDEVKAARNDLDVLNGELQDEIPLGAVPPPGRQIMHLPVYGAQWRENPDQIQWSRSMNDDPRHRGVAGLGNRMAVLEQESLLAAAVEQAGALQDAGQRIGFLAFGLDAAKRLWQTRLPEAPEIRLRLFGPAMGRMPAEGGGTVLGRVTGEESIVDSALFSSAAQRLLRDGTARARLSAGAGRIDRAAFLRAANTPAAPPNKTLPGMPHVDTIARELGERPFEEAIGLPDFGERLWDVLRKFDGRVVDQGHVVAFLEVVNDALGLQCGDWILSFYNELLETAQDPAPVFDTENMLGAIERCLGSNISDIAKRAGLSAALPRPEPPDPRRPIALDRLADAVAAAIDPTQVMPPAWARVKATIDGLDLSTLEPREAPIGLDYPTWTLVNAHAREWLLPGAGSIPKDSVVALQTNPTFVDAFMVGINTQFIAEMRWRNLPAPRIGTPLRMFWGYANHETGVRDPDIQPINDWPSRDLGALGADDVGDISHQNVRPGDVTGRRDLVIAFRTALFRRYPSTLVYLVRALPGDDLDARLKSAPDFTIPADPAQRWCFGPIFFGTMEPDLVFFAFDVDPDAVEECWLVLDEPPTELRFRNDQGTNWPDSATFADKTIDHPTRIAISGAVLKTESELHP